MTTPELIAFTIGAALVGIAWMTCHWATIARTAPRTPEVASEPALAPDRPAGDESCPEDCVCRTSDWWHTYDPATDGPLIPLRHPNPLAAIATVRTVDLTAPEPEEGR